MKRRFFLQSSGSLMGLMVPILGRAQVRPCPPPSLSAAGGSSTQQACTAISADWLARSAGPGVVWAHDFRNAAEITAHLSGAQAGVGHAGDALKPFQVTDGLIGHAMRFVALGARLTQDFPASGGPGPRSLVIDDATHWPDPAVSGPFYVHLTKPQVEQRNNLLLVTARKGTSLTVTYVPSSGQPFQTTQRDWLVGDHVGHQTGTNWVRVFSALKGDSNGIGADDINRAGVKLRSKKDPVNFPWGRQAFGYGWYGRPEYQAQFATWRPSDHGNYAIDDVLRRDLWDGEEFYIQFRMKVDRRFHTHNPIDSASEDGRYGRKAWMLQSEMTVPQQITAGYGPSNRYGIPSTPEPPFKMAAYGFGGGLAGRTLTANLDGSGSFQPGSKWAATALPASFLPAGSAWEFPAGEWVTFLLFVRPGLRWSRDNPSASGVRNTVIEMKVARENDSDYTTVFSVQDQAMIYGSSGPNEDQWRTALPGYNAFAPTGYLNVDLGSVPPAAAYSIDFGQVIFSKQPIPAPKD